MVVLEPYEAYYQRYRGLVTDLPTRFPPGKRPDDERAFIALFGSILRLRNILLSFDEFTPDVWLLSERQLQDYQSLYLDLHAERRGLRNDDKESINDDIVFEIELVKQVALDLPAILAHVSACHAQNMTDSQIAAEVARSVDSSPTLRSKKKLIEAFLATLSPGEDVDARGASVEASPLRAERGPGECRLPVKQALLDRETVPEAAQRPVGAQHPVAGHEQGGGVQRTGRTGRPDGTRPPRQRGVLGIGQGMPGFDRPQGVPGVRPERT